MKLRNIILALAIIIIVASAGVSIAIYAKKVRFSASGNIAGYDINYGDLHQFRDDSGTAHTIGTVIQVDKSGLVNVKDLQGIEAKIEGLNRNLKNLENYQKFGTETTIKKTIVLKHDTVNLTDTSKTLIQSFNYSDKWNSVSGVLSDDSVIITVISVDSLENVVYYKRKWFLGRKEYEFETLNSNPNNLIKYSKSIKVQKRRRL